MPIDQQSLSAGERDRAAAFRQPRDRRRWAASRIAMRQLLGSYLNQNPRKIRFSTTEYGKPVLDAPWMNSLAFNLSHSRDLSLLAIASRGPLGVDIEWVREIPDLFTIVERFFCDEESRELRSLRQAEVHRAFFRAWTRKEAYLKAEGRGLAAGLDQIQVTLGPDARIVAIGGSRQSAERWRLIHFEPFAEYVAALALPSDREVRLCVREFPGDA